MVSPFQASIPKRIYQKMCPNRDPCVGHEDIETGRPNCWRSCWFRSQRSRSDNERHQASKDMFQCFRPQVAHEFYAVCCAQLLHQGLHHFSRPRTFGSFTKLRTPWIFSAELWQLWLWGSPRRERESRTAEEDICAGIASRLEDIARRLEDLLFVRFLRGPVLFRLHGRRPPITKACNYSVCSCILSVPLREESANMKAKLIQFYGHRTHSVQSS